VHKFGAYKYLLPEANTKEIQIVLRIDNFVRFST
jgi:hypothetical protein